MFSVRKVEPMGDKLAQRMPVRKRLQQRPKSVRSIRESVPGQGWRIAARSLRWIHLENDEFARSADERTAPVRLIDLCCHSPLYSPAF